MRDETVGPTLGDFPRRRGFLSPRLRVSHSVRLPASRHAARLDASPGGRAGRFGLDRFVGLGYGLRCDALPWG